MISIVIPIYNEAETIPLLYNRLSAVLPALKDKCEIVFVDDGSHDESLTIMNHYANENNAIRVLKLSRNFGHQAAISAGLKYASGDAVVIMDGDLQDPPEELPRFLEKWREGFDVVYAIREKRKEGIFKRMAYRSFYRILDLVSDIEIPLDSGDFCVLDRKVVNVLNNELPENIRFVRGLRSYAGFRQIGLKYERHGRSAGQVKYTLKKLIKLALDGIFGFTLLPLKMATYSGLFVAVSSLAIGLVFLMARFFNFPILGAHVQDVPGFTTLAVGGFFLGGIILLFMGILGEYMGRIYIEVKQRPQYIVEQVIENKQPSASYNEIYDK